MRTLPCAVRQVLAPFAPLFSTRVFRHAVLLVIGSILAPGRRTVTAALRMLRLKASLQFQNYHRGLCQLERVSAGEGRYCQMLILLANSLRHIQAEPSAAQRWIVASSPAPLPSARPQDGPS